MPRSAAEILVSEREQKASSTSFTLGPLLYASRSKPRSFCGPLTTATTTASPMRLNSVGTRSECDGDVGPRRIPLR